MCTYMATWSTENFQTIVKAESEMYISCIGKKNKVWNAIVHWFPCGKGATLSHLSKLIN